MNELQNQGELKKTLSLPLLIGFGLAYLAPTVVSTTTASGHAKTERQATIRWHCSSQQS